MQNRGEKVQGRGINETMGPDEILIFLVIIILNGGPLVLIVLAGKFVQNPQFRLRTVLIGMTIIALLVTLFAFVVNERIGNAGWRDQSDGQELPHDGAL